MFKVSPEEEGEPFHCGRAQLHLRLHCRDGRSGSLLGQLSNRGRRHFFSGRNLEFILLQISCLIISDNIMLILVPLPSVLSREVKAMQPAGPCLQQVLPCLV